MEPEKRRRRMKEGTKSERLHSTRRWSFPLIRTSWSFPLLSIRLWYHPHFRGSDGMDQLCKHLLLDCSCDFPLKLNTRRSPAIIGMPDGCSGLHNNDCDLRDNPGTTAMTECGGKLSKKRTNKNTFWIQEVAQSKATLSRHSQTQRSKAQALKMKIKPPWNYKDVFLATC